jgi:S-phase kinase-associated protein 1
MSTVKLTSGDGQEFTVPVEVAKLSDTIKHQLEDIGGGDTGIPLPNITGAILKLVVEYCTYHQAHAEPTEEKKFDEKKWTVEDFIPFDQEFVKRLDQNTIIELILAANYLDIKSLLDITTKTIAYTMKGKTPEEIRKMYNIEGEFTPAEEEEIKKDKEWCDDN